MAWIDPSLRARSSAFDYIVFNDTSKLVNHTEMIIAALKGGFGMLVSICEKDLSKLYRI